MPRSGRSLADLPWAGPLVTRQISPENPDGARGAGAMTVPNPSDPDLPHSVHAVNLGRGYKVRPFIRVGAGERRTIAAIAGAGVVTNFFLTSNIVDLSDLWLDIRWDGESKPSVSVNIASFFCLGGPGQHHEVASIPINVGPVRGCSSSWAMPFREGAVFELENRGSTDAEVVAYKVTYEERSVTDVPPSRFRAMTTSGHPTTPDFEVDVLTAIGRGLIVGTSINWRAMRPRWWGEGEIKVYLGNDDFPTLVDTGTEDYFGGAWGFGRDTTFLRNGPEGERPYAGLYAGAPYLESNEGYPREIVLYRWHINDPIGFDDGVRLAVQVMGIGPDGKYELRDDELTATGYWYAIAP
ncbi:MAG TPA: glycoside hydrolase family 172 protein [Galbitalea sp.]